MNLWNFLPSLFFIVPNRNKVATIWYYQSVKSSLCSLNVRTTDWPFLVFCWSSNIELTFKKTDFLFLIIRTTTGCTSGTRVHPEDVRRPESRQWQNYLLPLHMRYRHREYPLRLCCCQGHNPTVKPEGVQPGLTVPRRPSKTNFAWLKIYKRDCIICENNLHNTNLLPAWTLWMSTEFVVNIMILFKTIWRKTKRCWSTFTAHFLIF